MSLTTCYYECNHNHTIWQLFSENMHAIHLFLTINCQKWRVFGNETDYLVVFLKFE